MTIPDLEKDVYIVCSCERTCRKDGHAISATLLTEGARCSVWISRRHLCTVAQTTLRRIRNEERRLIGGPQTEAVKHFAKSGA